MAETMIERVKRALLPIIQNGIPGTITDDAIADAMARAAIEAMREPTRAVLDGGVWRSTIDAILKETADGD